MTFSHTSWLSCGPWLEIHVQVMTLMSQVCNMSCGSFVIHVHIICYMSACVLWKFPCDLCICNDIYVKCLLVSCGSWFASLLHVMVSMSHVCVCPVEVGLQVLSCGSCFASLVHVMTLMSHVCLCPVEVALQVLYM